MVFLTVITTALLTMATVQAQTNETLNLYGSVGYGFGTGGQLFSSTKLSTGPAGIDTVERKDHYFNYGRGFKFDLGLQYYAMENVALQAGFCYSAGVPSLESSLRIDTATSLSSDSVNTFHHHLFGIKVLAVPRFEILELMNIYTGIGFGFFWNSLQYEIVKTTPGGTQNEKGAIQSSPTPGLTGLIGGEYPLSDQLLLIGEVGFDQMSFTWKKRIVDESQFGRKKGSYNYEKDTPNQEPPLKISASNWRMSVGVRYILK